MRHKLLVLVLAVLIGMRLFAQLPDHSIRIVDTLNAQKTSRNPVLLRAELDSMIKAFNAAQVQEVVDVPDQKPDNTFPIILSSALAGILLILAIMAIQFYRYRRRFNRVVTSFTGKLRYMEINAGVKQSANASDGIKSFPPKTSNDMAKEKTARSKVAAGTLEGKITELHDEMNKLKKENETLSMVINEYNGIQHEYDSLKHGLSKAYKVKNYPGYEKSKPEMAIFQGVLDTEFSVANYAYEKFLRPILAISDANKNNPAKISEEDRGKVMDLLISLSLLYIEYLYLRVNDLAIGGKMVERINGLKKGNGLDPGLLKELNLDHGSRALVLRMVLDKFSLNKLSYPVFDETNLNN